MAFTCPRCGRTSQDPGDARQGYCGACHDWTAPAVAGEDAARHYQCESCGLRKAVPPRHVGRVWCPCGSARAMAPAPWVTAAGVRGGSIMANSRGLWQYIGRTEEDLWYCAQYGDAVPLPEFEELRDRIGRCLAAHASGLISLDQLRLEVSGYLDEGTTALITGSQRIVGTDSGDCPPPSPGRQPEVDDTPWADPMSWSPGDAEL